MARRWSARGPGPLLPSLIPAESGGFHSQTQDSTQFYSTQYSVLYSVILMQPNNRKNQISYDLSPLSLLNGQRTRSGQMPSDRSTTP
ncbi:hypothetical protein BO70DRAFT_31414 [Aspergillus heteromorphus CBS 117.55]|uniref:Uncharacterized protein n=1 Tax=Aspergillus heteromorphus CBS 117.55 TaxID=1448321 RepID=A0A317WF77_9EURO|nr:uncharacterized protein BO70DRAFT_31414 [Aspergillus heteromorphus CBS 117.55]PWY82890.1 hypothetical protein BO70DRAFT_31414 [Aspergillus heteromorphus CBS 117.55]